MSPRIKVNPVFQIQANASVIQANPVSGTKYTLLDTVRNARLYYVGLKVTWTVQPTPLEAHITVDGVEYTWSLTNPVSAAWNYCQPLAAQALKAHDAYLGTFAFIVEGRSVKVTMETTGGTVSALEGLVKYGVV